MLLSHGFNLRDEDFLVCVGDRFCRQKKNFFSGNSGHGFVPLLLRNVQLLRDHWTNWNSWNKFTKSKVILINVLNFSLLIRWCLICKFVMLICVRNTLRSKPEKYVKQIFRFKKTYLNDFNTAKIIRLKLHIVSQNPELSYTKNNFFKLTEPGPSLWITFSRFCLDFVHEFGIDWSHLKNKKSYKFSSHFSYMS